MSTTLAKLPAARDQAHAATGSAASQEEPPNGPLRVEERSASGDISHFSEDWEDLSADAVERNVFYERWNLGPALRWLRKEEAVDLLLVYRRGNRPDVPERLCLFAPIVRERCERVPASAWKLWRHPYCYLQTPLVRA